MRDCNPSFITKKGDSLNGFNCELTLYLSKTGQLQVSVSKKHSTLDHWKWCPETITVPLKCVTAIAPLK